MDLQIVLVFHVLVDIILCAMILILLRKVASLTKERKNDAPVSVDSVPIPERDSTLTFESTLENTLTARRLPKNNGAPAGKAKGLSLGKRVARRVKNLFSGRSTSRETFSGERYRAAVDLASQGVSLEHIASTLGLAEGEIALVLDLDRTRNESS